MNILIVEDHAATAKLLSEYLTKQGEYDVIDIAYNGKEAIKKITQKPVDVVLMDVNMPFVDGIEATENILYKIPHIKVLMLSVYSEPWIIKRSIKAGAHGYLNKKAGIDKISQAITEISRGKPYLDESSLNTIMNDYDYS